MEMKISLVALNFHFHSKFNKDEVLLQEAAALFLWFTWHRLKKGLCLSEEGCFFPKTFYILSILFFPILVTFWKSSIPENSYLSFCLLVELQLGEVTLLAWPPTSYSTCLFFVF